MRAVVGRVHDHRIVGDAEIVEQLQQLADMHVVLDHAVVVFVTARARDAGMLFLHMRAEMHAGAVPPHEPRLLGLVLLLDERLGRSDGLVVDGFHAFFGQRTGVLDLHVTRIIAVLRLFLGVQVIEVAEELVEAVHGGQMLVAIALVVLAELSSGVTLALEYGRHGDVGLLPALFGARQADLGHAATHRHAAADEGRAAGGAALLRVVVGEAEAFGGDAVDVGRAVAHHAAVVEADVPGTDVVAPDDEDVRLLVLRPRVGRQGKHCKQRRCDDGRNMARQVSEVLHCRFLPCLQRETSIMPS